jgi:hypothetical protein
MIFWIREIAGWILVLLGLLIMGNCLAWIENRQVVGASFAAGMGIFVFRGGIQLIKVAVAGRAVLHAEQLARNPSPISSAK